MIDILLVALCICVAVYSGYFFWSNRTASTVSNTPIDVLFEDKPVRVRKPSKLRGSLRTLDLQVEPILVIAIIGLLGACVYFLFIELFPDMGRFALLAAAGFTCMAFFVINDMSLWRRRKFEERMVDSLDLIQAAIQGGVTARHALLVAADASDGAIKKELTEIVERLDYGLTIEVAVDRMQKRYDTEGVRLFSQALISKWHSGSDFGLLLKSISELIRDQLRLRMLITGQLSGVRYSAVFTGALPYLLVPLFLWKEPNWFDPLKNNPDGATYVLGAILLQVFGYLWLRRLLRTEL